MERRAGLYQVAPGGAAEEEHPGRSCEVLCSNFSPPLSAGPFSAIAFPS